MVVSHRDSNRIEQHFANKRFRRHMIERSTQAVRREVVLVDVFKGGRNDAPFAMWESFEHLTARRLVVGQMHGQKQGQMHGQVHGRHCEQLVVCYRYTGQKLVPFVGFVYVPISCVRGTIKSESDIGYDSSRTWSKPRHRLR